MCILKLDEKVADINASEGLLFGNPKFHKVTLSVYPVIYSSTGLWKQKLSLQ